MTHPTLHTVTSLDMAALTNRPRRFIHRDLMTLFTKLADAGLVGKEVGDGGLVRWFNKKAEASSYWVGGEYQYLDLRNRKQTALYIAKDFLMVVAARIDCDATRKKYISLM
ncbi:hypothetical protein [Pseudomonas sp. FH1]|uniref:hypothetical protein n=1 Tax=Pseudomonas sp. FH1 TaxID=1284392 RepID=UPI0003DDA9BA|nr:hypothetical protein [Pseudomonas sp. FH1]ETK22073.1 hypothetical protein H096_17498 [Pseudomonas sp. FH1]